MTEPLIIQGGMGAGVSNWILARAVSQTGQLGVVSGTALDSIMARRLQVGDLDGAMRRALAAFPNQAAAKRILDRYYIAGGKKETESFRPLPSFTPNTCRELLELNVAANFAEVYLAKEGHAGRVGINFLEKIHLPLLSCLYGALLAGVDYVLVGAGIPRQVPALLDELSQHKTVSMKIYVHGAPAQEDCQVTFEPKEVIPDPGPALKRPRFLAIIASEVLALTLAKKSTGKVDGFVIEGPTAGGHNAPPRGPLQLTDSGEPIYGVKDEVDLKKIKALGLPFWLAGSQADPVKLKEALEAGAAGLQVGSVFAYCEESGLAQWIKKNVIEGLRAGWVKVFTDPKASPTGFPFKVVNLPGTYSEKDEYLERKRICDLGYLRSLYRRKDGTTGARCASEPEKTYLQKNGEMADTLDRKCLCNGLMANIGLGQIRKDGSVEKALVTSGDDVGKILKFLPEGKESYSAKEVVAYLLEALQPQPEKWAWSPLSLFGLSETTTPISAV
jgi:nitronate monooxygenase